MGFWLFFVSRSVRHITTPLLILSSHLDLGVTYSSGCGDVSAEFQARWKAGHAKEVEDLMTARPDIAFYAPNCIHSGCMAWDYLVPQHETGERIGVLDFIKNWLRGDGRTPQHANDDVMVDNPTCPEVPT